MDHTHPYPDAVDPARVGTYPAPARSGGGFVWDDVLEYRVWCHPERGAPDEQDGSDYFYAFPTYESADIFADTTAGTEAPLALIRQVEWIAESESGELRHMREERITEWPVELLRRPRRTPQTIPALLAADTPEHRLAILGGLTGRIL